MSHCWLLSLCLIKLPGLTPGGRTLCPCIHGVWLTGKGATCFKGPSQLSSCS